MAHEYDLTKRLAPFLDRHLLVMMLEYLDSKNVYPKNDMARAKLEVCEKTNLVDYAIAIWQQLHGSKDVPQDMQKKRSQLPEILKSLETAAKPLLDLLNNQQLLTTLRNDMKLTLANLEQYGVKEEHLEALYKLAKAQYECGRYPQAITHLGLYRELSRDQEKATSALWGQLAGNILMGNWDQAAEDLKQLRDILDSKSFTSVMKQLQQRTWFIHWSLFVFFNHQAGRTGIIDLFLSDRYLNTIQTTSPHILRYLAAAVILNKKKRTMLKEIVKVIEMESYRYRDPITEFLESLFINFDFQTAEEKLRLAEKILDIDFFLNKFKDEFIENARLMIFETYCKIHSRIDISLLSEKLSMKQEEAERWIVNLVRNARFDAKIDSAANQVILGSQVASPYQQLIDKTKNLSFRSVVLSNTIERARTVKHTPQPQPQTHSQTPVQQPQQAAQPKQP
jgi:translation initiation factor 3 subunit E